MKMRNATVTPNAQQRFASKKARVCTLGSMSPVQMLLAAHPESGQALLDALGVEHIA